jgi:hypothetical protein
MCSGYYMFIIRGNEVIDDRRRNRGTCSLYKRVLVRYRPIIIIIIIIIERTYENSPNKILYDNMNCNRNVKYIPIKIKFQVK